MFRIRQVRDAGSIQNQLALAAVLRIYQEAFPDDKQYSTRISELLNFAGEQDFEVVLLVAEGHKNRHLGFALTFYFGRQRMGYLDYIISNPKRNARGYGGALYEATCELLAQRKARGLFMDVPADDVNLLKERQRLSANKRRLAFYERFGARPVADTAYETTMQAVNGGHGTMLVFDNLDTGKPLEGRDLRAFVRRLLSAKGSLQPDDPRLKNLIKSIRDGPVHIREPVYSRPIRHRPAKHEGTLELITTGDAHQIHHLREKGYVERPARVHSILKGLEGVKLKQFNIRNYAEKHILRVHHTDLLSFLKAARKNLDSAQLLYPSIFPIRRPERIPAAWDMRAGYYCIDTFTPVTANAFTAARTAVNAALTGADRLLKGSRRVYSLGRPPGHHAESRAFGGFCYFNNAAIAADHLSASGKVGLLDIDHHHGNGSQEIFYRRKDVYFVSIHGHPRLCYPYFAGYADERGEGRGKGFNRNYPLYPGVDDHQYCETLSRALGILERFKPDYLVVSLGFDIMAGDPTGTFNVSARGMYRIGKMLAETGLPVLVVQEGGYSLRNLRLGAIEFFRGITRC
jgi:acetoin utilization deacetylase AcuC-like enzyme